MRPWRRMKADALAGVIACGLRGAGERVGGAAKTGNCRRDCHILGKCQRQEICGDTTAGLLASLASESDVIYLRHIQREADGGAANYGLARLAVLPETDAVLQRRSIVTTSAADRRFNRRHA